MVNDKPKPIPSELSQKRAAAGRAGAKKRWDATRVAAAAVAAEIGKKRRQRLPKHIRTIGDLDAVLGMPVSWSEGLRRAKCETELEILRQRKIENDRLSGSLVLRSDAEAAAQSILKRFEREGQLLPGRIVELVPDASNEVKGAISRAVTAAWNTVLEEVGKP